MAPLVWESGAFPSPAELTIPVIRFSEPKSPKRRWHVWLLGEAVQRGVHFKSGTGSVPCLLPSSCPICEKPDSKSLGWSKQIEAYAPALVERKGRNFWDPVVVVFTQSVLKNLLPQAPLRGLMAEFFREYQGSCNRLKYELKDVRVNPPIEPFDIKPVMERLWDPFANVVLPSVDSIPTTNPVFKPQLATPTKAEVAANSELVRAMDEAEKRGEKFSVAEHYRRKELERKAFQAALNAPGSKAEAYNLELQRLLEKAVSSPEGVQDGNLDVGDGENAAELKPAASEFDSEGTSDRLPEPQPAEMTSQGQNCDHDIQKPIEPREPAHDAKTHVGASIFSEMSPTQLLAFVNSFENLPPMSELVRIARQRLDQQAKQEPEQQADDIVLSMHGSEEPQFFNFTQFVNSKVGEIVSKDQKKRLTKKGGAK